MKNSSLKRPNLLKIIEDNYNNKQKQLRSGGNPSSLKSKANTSNPYMYDDQMFYHGGYISDRAKATQFGQYARGGSPCPEGFIYNEEVDDCVPIDALQPNEQNNARIDNRKFNAGVGFSDPRYNFNYGFSINPLTKNEVNHNASLNLPDLFRVGSNKANLNLSGNYSPNREWRGNLSAGIPISHNKNRQDRISVTGGVGQNFMANPSGHNYNAGVEYLGKMLGEKGPTVKINAGYSKYKRGGGYFPPYHSYTPPRMDEGGDPSKPYHPINNPDGYREGVSPLVAIANAQRQSVKTPYQPSQTLNNVKGILAGIDASTGFSSNPYVRGINLLARGANSAADAYTAGRYAMDNQRTNAAVDAGEAILDLVPYRRGKKVINLRKNSGLPAFYNKTSKLDKSINTGLKVGKARASADDFTNSTLGRFLFGDPNLIQNEYGGDISIPDLNTNDMNIMDYMQYGGIYAYADGGNTKTSIVDYLDAQGMASDKASRKKLAESMGIKGYTGSYDQNVEMVTRLNQGRYNPSRQAEQNPYVVARTAPAAQPQSGFGSMPRMSQAAPAQTAPAPRVSKKPTAKQAPVQQTAMGQDSGFRPYSPEQLNQMYNFPGTLSFKTPTSKPATTAKQAAARKTKQANAEDQRNLESGMITDKGTNMTHVIQNGKIVKSFPVLTGQARDVNYAPYNLDQLGKNPNLRGTPVGTYFSKPDANLYGEKGFRMSPIPAFGQPAPVAQPGLAQHITFGKKEDPAEYRRREALYNQSPAARATSYGCTNCRKPDLDYIVNAFPQGDTTMVIDSRRAADANLLKNRFKKKADGGENDYSGTYSAGVYYGQGGSFVPEFYSPEYGLPEMMYGMGMAYGGMYDNGGLVKGGEYEMSEEEIQDLIDQGYKIQYI